MFIYFDDRNIFSKWKKGTFVKQLLRVAPELTLSLDREATGPFEQHKGVCFSYFPHYCDKVTDKGN